MSDDTTVQVPVAFLRALSKQSSYADYSDVELLEKAAELISIYGIEFALEEIKKSL